MRQWFRGKLEATYVGVPVPRRPAVHPLATHYALRLLRGAVRELERIEAPDAAPAHSSAEAAHTGAENAHSGAENAHSGAENARSGAEAALFCQKILEDTWVPGIRGAGSAFRGPVFDVRVTDARLEHGVRKGERTYGLLTGTVVGYCELPEEPAPRAVEAEVVKAAPPIESAPLPATLYVGAARGESSDPRRAAHPAESLPSQHDERAAPLLDGSTAEAAPLLHASTAEATPLLHASTADFQPAPHADTTQADERTAPLLSIAAAVAIALGVGCGGTAAFLWLLFMLPSLGARSLFRGVLRDSTGLRAFGFGLIVIQLLCSSTLASEWWSSECRTLHVLPLIGLVSVIFPSSLLPSLLPLGFNAAGLGLVLSLWCGGGECHDDLAHPRPNVHQPSVPRVNPDGTWPRKPSAPAL